MIVLTIITDRCLKNNNSVKLRIIDSSHALGMNACKSIDKIATPPYIDSLFP